MVNTETRLGIDTAVGKVLDNFGEMVEDEERKWCIGLLKESLEENPNNEYTAGLEHAIDLLKPQEE